VDSRSIQIQVNLPYVVQFGFGSYRIGGLSVGAYELPVTHTFALGSGEDASRLRIAGLLGYSHAAFESHALGPEVAASEGFVFFLPTTELQIPLQPWWTVKPFVSAGLGWILTGSVTIEGQPGGHLNSGSVFLYAAGIGNLFEVLAQKFHLSFGTRLEWAGDSPIGQSGSEGYGMLQNGLEVRHQIGFRVGSFVPDVGIFVIHYFFFPSAKFSLPARNPFEVFNQVELGVSVGSAVPATLWILENPRIGASYRFGNGLSGIAVNFGFPF
jgi:hypothetical protein